MCLVPKWNIFLFNVFKSDMQIKDLTWNSSKFNAFKILNCEIFH